MCFLNIYSKKMTSKPYVYITKNFENMAKNVEESMFHAKKAIFSIDDMFNIGFQQECIRGEFRTSFVINQDSTSGHYRMEILNVSIIPDTLSVSIYKNIKKIKNHLSDTTGLNTKDATLLNIIVEILNNDNLVSKKKRNNTI